MDPDPQPGEPSSRLILAGASLLVGVVLSAVGALVLWGWAGSLVIAGVELVVFGLALAWEPEP